MKIQTKQEERDLTQGIAVGLFLLALLIAKTWYLLQHPLN